MGQGRSQCAHLGYAANVSEFRLKILEPKLGLLSFRQIPDEAGENPPAFKPGLTHGQFDRESETVPVPGGGHSADADNLALPGLEIFVEVGIVPLPVWRGHEHADILAEDLVLGEPEHFLSRQ